MPGVEQIECLDQSYYRKDRGFLTISCVPLANKIWKIILKNWNLTDDVPGCQLPPIVGLCCTKNIMDIVIKFDIKALTPDCGLLKGHQKCGRCKVCPQELEGDFIEVTGQKIQLNVFSTCNTSECMYLI